MNSPTLIVRFPAAVCILLILFVGRRLAQETTIDVALLNIGGHFGMEPKLVLALKARGVAFREMKPGQTLTFQGSRIR